MKKVLALIVLCFIAFNSHAQLKYQNGYLVYNAMERYNGYMTNWEGWAHCWKFGNRMIKFDLGPADSRVSSNSDKLVLYDTENGGGCVSAVSSTCTPATSIRTPTLRRKQISSR